MKLSPFCLPFATCLTSVIAIQQISNDTILPPLEANYTSPLGVEVYNPENAFEPTATWSLMSKAGQTLYIAGMRGIDRSNNSLVEVGHPRVWQAFDNMRYLAELAGTDLVCISPPKSSRGSGKANVIRHLACG